MVKNFMGIPAYNARFSSYASTAPEIVNGLYFVTITEKMPTNSIKDIYNNYMELLEKLRI